MNTVQNLLEARRRVLGSEAAWLKVRGRDDAHQVLDTFAGLAPEVANAVLLDAVRTCVVLATKARGTVRHQDRVDATRLIATLRLALRDTQTALRNLERQQAEEALTGEVQAGEPSIHNPELGVETAPPPAPAAI